MRKSLTLALILFALGCTSIQSGETKFKVDKTKVRRSVTQLLNLYEVYVETDPSLSKDQRQGLLALSAGLRSTLFEDRVDWVQRVQLGFAAVASSYYDYISQDPNLTERERQTLYFGITTAELAIDTLLSQLRDDN